MLYSIALSLLKGVRTTTAAKLLEHTNGDSKALFHLTPKELEAIGKNTSKLLSPEAKTKALLAAEKELSFIAAHKITPLFFTDAAYPSRLSECKGSPAVLYTKGNCDLNALRCLSVVGTRQPTQHGIDTTKSLIAEIAKTFPNTLIVSGLAYGIDITAHKAALQNNLPTAAVLGHGLQMIYPAAHRSLAEQIVKSNGTLLTQYHSNSKVIPQNFIERNSIIAAISDATIVIESKQKGGAMATAHIANSYGRDVLAIPGNTREEKSRGCNQLIKTQVAALIENAKDIGYTLGWETKSEDSQQRLFFDLSPEERAITTLLQQKGKMSLDRICQELSSPTSSLLPLITQLEFKDLLLGHPGKFYSLKK